MLQDDIDIPDDDRMRSKVIVNMDFFLFFLFPANMPGQKWSP
jgi:hypothetical protein